MTAVGSRTPDDRIDARQGSFLPQVVGGRRVIPGQPQNAAFDGFEDSHSRSKNMRVQLVGVIEAAEDEAAFGQPEFRSFKNAIRDQAIFVVMRHVTVGKIGDLLHIMSLIGLRNKSWSATM